MAYESYLISIISMSIIVIILASVIIYERLRYKNNNNIKQLHKELNMELYSFMKNECKSEPQMHKWLKEKFRYYRI